MISIADIVDKNACHPGFVAAAGIELKDERNLILVPEKNLSKEPIRIDLFVQGEMVRRHSDMCEALRELMKDEIEAEKRESEKKGSFETAILMIKNLMRNTGVSAEQAMEDLGIAVTDRNEYIARL